VVVVAGGVLLPACDGHEPPAAGESAISERILEGLATDERILACVPVEPGKIIDPGQLALTVQRVDLDGDRVPDWLIAGTDDCLDRDGAMPWWVYADHGTTDADGPDRVLRVDADAIEVMSETSAGLHDLRVLKADLPTVWRFDGEQYRAAGGPAAGASGAAGDGLVVDYGSLPVAEDDVTRPPGIDARVAAALPEGGGANAELMAVAHGAFTQADARQDLVILQPGGPRAVEPVSERRPAIGAIFEADQLVQRYELDPALGATIAGTPDLDGDARAEVVLLATSTNMGVTSTSASLVQFDAGQINILLSPTPIAEDGCDGPPLSRERRWARIEHAAGQPLDAADAYTTIWRDAGCD